MMGSSRQYEYSEEQRSFIETSVIPFAFFRVENQKVKTLLISDGLCSLLCEDRENAARCLEYDIYNYVHKEDVAGVKARCKQFFFGDGEVNISFRVRLKGDSEYHNIYLSGKKIVSDKGEKIFVLWYNDVNVQNYNSENAEQKNDFEKFLKGEANDMLFHTFGYKGYSLWDITQDKLLFETGLGYVSGLLEDGFGYREYYSLNKGWLYEEKDIQFFEMLSPENIKENFKKNIPFEEHIFTFSSDKGQISVKITPSVSRSPHNGSICLKLQAENVTDSVIYENLMYFSVKAAEFIAQIEGNAAMVYFVGNNLKTKIPLSEMLTVFSAQFGYNFANVQQVIQFMEYKCDNKNNAVIINRISEECIKSIRIEVINREEQRYFVSGTNVTAAMDMEINSYYDELTKLLNMSAFRMMAQSVIDKLRLEKKVPVLVYFDLRDMKAINEKYGFECGNNVLRGTAYTLKKVFAGDLISRLAEDHFVVLTDKKSIEQKIESVHEKVLKNPFGIPVKICAGMYVDNGQNLDIDSVCDRARLACKSIKDDYNRKYRLFDSDMFEEYHRRRYILTHFEEALENHYFKVYYHPIIRCLTGHVCDVEALVRWVKPDRGTVQPSQFISVLEEHRLIYKLDFYMVRKICEDLDMLRAKNFPIVPVSVNLSRVDFEMCDVVAEVIKIVDSYRIPHKLLTIEITESAFIHNSRLLDSQINRFREAGFDAWMDDFGSEYSSLNTLQEFTFDLIKLDMKFMSHFTPNSKNSSILSDVIGMVTKLGIHTLAEGVDSKEQLHFLRDVGCEKAQGFLFSHPMPIEYFMEQHSRNAGLQYDDVAMSDYYNQIGAVRLDNSLLSEHRISIGETALSVPAAVIEYRNEKFRILKANDEYKRFLDKIGLGEQCADNEYFEWQKQPSKNFSLAAIKCLVTHSSETICDDMESGYLVSAKLICISYNYSTDIGAFITVVEKYRKKN